MIEFVRAVWTVQKNMIVSAYETLARPEVIIPVAIITGITIYIATKKDLKNN